MNRGRSRAASASALGARALRLARQLGPRRTAELARDLTWTRWTAPVRRRWLRVRPTMPSPAAARRAAGGRGAAGRLRGVTLRCLPTVAAFEEDLDRMDAAERRDLAGRADRILRHEFDLLGSGPVDLGAEIDWTCDFKSGRRWPLDHISEIVVSYPDRSDIKVPWELSRFQHLPPLAAAFRLTADRRYLDEVGAQMTDFARANPVEFGPNWACTMDVAIRGANWVATLAMLGEAAAGEAWFDGALASLLAHGRFIRSHLEWSEVRGNHFLSDVVGLLPVAALFISTREGRAWASWAADRLGEEMDHQVRPDGCDHEASIPYHRLVTELFICGVQAADALLPGRIADRHRRRLDAMLAFVRDYTRPDGLAPQIGDADSGRFLPLGDYGAGDFRNHSHLFRQAGRPLQSAAGHASYRDGGYYIMRGAGLYLIVRCGDNGLGSIGGHAHNDQLSFELCLGDQPIIVDPGSYLYTADPDERNLFRSTAFHATLAIDGREQNPLDRDYLFALPDRSRARLLDWRTDEDGGATFEGRHVGFGEAIHRRRIELGGGTGEVTVVDWVESPEPHDVEWSFMLAEGGEVKIAGGEATCAFPRDHALAISSSEVEFTQDEAWYSPEYGVKRPVRRLRARMRSEPGVSSAEFRLRPAHPADETW